MKKFFMVSALLLVGVMSANARFGLGIVFGGGGSWGTYSGSWGGGLSIGLGEIDAAKFEAGLRFWGSSSNGFQINVDTSWHVVNVSFTDWVGFYFGLGPYLGMRINNHSTTVSGSEINSHYFGLDVGARLPLGIRFFLANHFDIWLAGVPHLGLAMRFAGSSTTISGVESKVKDNKFGFGGGIGFEVGFRYWF